jgi:hypothetical protein
MEIGLPFAPRGEFFHGAIEIEERKEEERQIEAVGKILLQEAKSVQSLYGIKEIFFALFILKRGEKRGKEDEEHSRLDHQAHGLFGRSFLQLPEKFVPDPGWRAQPDPIHVGEQRPVGFSLDCEAGPRRMADDPDHPYRVLGEFFIRVPDGTDDPVAEVLQSSHVIDQRKIGNIIKDSVDGDIPPQGVFSGSSESVVGVGVGLRLCFIKFRMPTEGGDLDVFPSGKIYVGQAEAAADEAGIAEEVPYLPGMCIRGHIEVFRCLSQEKIADASSNQVGGKTMVVEAVKDP